jgi:hypothetical protein
MNEVVPIVTTKQNCETQNECIQIDSSAMEQIEKNCSKTVQGNNLSTTQGHPPRLTCECQKLQMAGAGRGER